MGISFICYWIAVLLLAGWLSILTSDFIRHKSHTNNKINKANTNISNLQFTVDDVIKTLHALKKDNDKK